MAGTEKTDGLMGRIAVSKAGRDKGIRYAVIGMNDDGTLMLCDGKAHKAAKPKKKKPKHLQFEAERIENISAILSAKGGTADAALRRALKTGAVHHEDAGDSLKEKLYRYMDKSGLTVNEMKPYFSYYPDKLYKNLVETGVIFNGIFA